MRNTRLNDTPVGGTETKYGAWTLTAREINHLSRRLIMMQMLVHQIRRPRSPRKGSPVPRECGARSSTSPRTAESLFFACSSPSLRTAFLTSRAYILPGGGDEEWRRKSQQSRKELQFFSKPMNNYCVRKYYFASPQGLGMVSDVPFTAPKPPRPKMRKRMKSFSVTGLCWTWRKRVYS